MILVVDDEAAIVKALCTVLEDDGYRVETAQDGVEAFEHLKDPQCKCMLLDVKMPRINGVELLILMESEGIAVPTIVMAGFDDYEEREFKQFANVVRFMPKPFEMQQMTSAVRECLQHSETRGRPAGSGPGE